MATKRESYQARQDRIRNTIARKIRSMVPKKMKTKRGRARIMAAVNLSDALDHQAIADIRDYELDAALDAVMGDPSINYLGRADRTQLNRAVNAVRDSLFELVELMEDMSDAAVNAQDLLDD